MVGVVSTGMQIIQPTLVSAHSSRQYSRRGVTLNSGGMGAGGEDRDNTHDSSSILNQYGSRRSKLRMDPSSYFRSSSSLGLVSSLPSSVNIR